MTGIENSSAVMALKANISNSNAECEAAVMKRMAHIYDAAHIARADIEEKTGKSVLRAVISSDGAGISAGNELLFKLWGDDGDNERGIAAGHLENFDFMVFARALASDSGASLGELFSMLFGDGEKARSQAERKIALLRNAQVNRAFEIFAEKLRGVEAVYEDNFQSLCESVYAGETEYSIIPVENSVDGRLDGLYRMMEKYGMQILMSCRVFSVDGSSTRFALAGRSGALLDHAGEIKLEFRITLKSPLELSDIMDASRFFGAEPERIDSLPGVFGGRENSFGILLDISNADAFGLITYLSLKFAQFVPAGMYVQITEGT